jgi:hypothetical protein
LGNEHLPFRLDLRELPLGLGDRGERRLLLPLGDRKVLVLRLDNDVRVVVRLQRVRPKPELPMPAVIFLWS